MSVGATRRRAAVVGCAVVLAAATAVVGAGTAAADAGYGPGTTRTVEGSAYGSLPSPDGELFVFLSLFDPPRKKAFAGVEVFANDGAYECFNGRHIKADLDDLEEAEAEGRTRLVCGGPDPDFPRKVTAYVEVDVEWTAFGRVTRETHTEPETGCTVHNLIRSADVTGSVTVRIPALGVETTITEGFGDLRRTTSICPA